MWECIRCKLTKPLSAYHSHKNYKTGHTPYCKDCDNQRRRSQSKSNQDFINLKKLEVGCVVCGYNEHPAALDFDHVDPSSKWSKDVCFKGGYGRRAVSSSWHIDKIKLEIAKCQVMCANCHRVKETRYGN